MLPQWNINVVIPGRRAIQFGYAGSYSGYPNISVRGMREALRLVRLHSRGPMNAVFRYPAVGVHAGATGPTKCSRRYWIRAGSSGNDSDSLVTP